MKKSKGVILVKNNERKKENTLLVTDPQVPELGVAEKMLRENGIEYSTIKATKETGCADFELLTPEGNFDGLHGIEGYIKYIKNG